MRMVDTYDLVADRLIGMADLCAFPRPVVVFVLGHSVQKHVDRGLASRLSRIIVLVATVGTCRAHDDLCSATSNPSTAGERTHASLCCCRCSRGNTACVGTSVFEVQ